MAFARIRVSRRIGWSVRHQHRNRHRIEHAPRDTAEDMLLQSRVAVATHRQQTALDHHAEREASEQQQHEDLGHHENQPGSVN